MAKFDHHCFTWMLKQWFLFVSLEILISRLFYNAISILVLVGSGVPESGLPALVIFAHSAAMGFA
jgi:hypothetical protein